MTKQETIQVLTLLASNYNSISQKTKEQKEVMVETWFECLGDLDYELVLQAVKKEIIESEYPPTIHAIRKGVVDLTHKAPKQAVEAWNEAYKMICRGSIITQEEFEKADPKIQSFFGNVRQIKELAQCDFETINTVVRGQFLKQYENLVAREQQDRLLPEKMKNLINEAISKMDLKLLEQKD